MGRRENEPYGEGRRAEDTKKGDEKGTGLHGNDEGGVGGVGVSESIEEARGNVVVTTGGEGGKSALETCGKRAVSGVLLCERIGRRTSECEEGSKTKQESREEKEEEMRGEPFSLVGNGENSHFNSLLALAAAAGTTEDGGTALFCKRGAAEAKEGERGMRGEITR